MRRGERRRSITLVTLVVLAAVALVVLRQETMTVHHPVPAGSRLVVVVEADTNRDEGQTTNRARALVGLCDAEVTARSEVTSVMATERRLTIVVEPTLDRPDQRQFQGCLQDLRLPHLQLRVVSMDEEPGAAPAGGR